MQTQKPITLNRDARAGSLIARMASASLQVPPARRETLWSRIDRLRAYRRRFWTPERYRMLWSEL